MQVLHVMSFIIERMRDKVRPFSGALVRYLPALWQESTEHNMLRCAILTTTTELVLVSEMIKWMQERIPIYIYNDEQVLYIIFMRKKCLYVRDRIFPLDA